MWKISEFFKDKTLSSINKIWARKKTSRFQKGNDANVKSENGSDQKFSKE